MKKLFLFITLLLFSETVFCQQKLRIYVNNGKPVDYYTWAIDSISFLPIDSKVSPKTADAIDLGLSVKWASFNLGATSASETGWMVGWADPTGSITSDKLDYFPTRVNTADVVNSESDIAKVIWGGQWRMPSKHEIEEILTNCSWEKTDNGYWAKADNGNKIFFPYVNSAREAIFNEYWSGMHNGTDSAYVLRIGDSKVALASALRSDKLFVRPVYGEYRIPVTVNVETTNIIGIDSVKVILKLDGYVNDIKEYGLMYSTTTQVFTEANKDAYQKISFTGAPTDNQRSVVIKGLQEGKTYNYVGYAIVGDSTILSKVAQFATNNRFPVPNVDDAVDLGLPSGTKWAPFNLGAKNETEFGGLYGWGDSTGLNESEFSHDYAVGIGNNTNIAGNKTYDVIAAKWGGYWSLPTKEQFDELKNEAYTTWNEVYDYQGVSGLNGFEIVSNKDASKKIFMPKAGYLNGKTVTERGSVAYYWTSNFDPEYTKGYYVRPFGQNDAITGTYDKQKHFSIRGVYLAPVVYPADSAAAKNVKAVDLGLSVEWADQNIKSVSDPSADAFFSWGNTKEQKTYTTSSYPYLHKAIGEDGKLTVDKDAAVQNWGGTWRMPTIEEWNELINYCKWTKTTKDGVVGYNVTGNGNTIFIPLSGQYNGSEITFKDHQALYWTSECKTDAMDNNSSAYGAFITVDAKPYYYVSGSNDRYFGSLIRPVRAKRK